MKTFISWIIANFEGVIFCIIFSIIAIFLFSNPPIKDDGTIISHKGLLEAPNTICSFYWRINLTNEKCWCRNNKIFADSSLSHLETWLR